MKLSRKDESMFVFLNSEMPTCNGLSLHRSINDVRYHFQNIVISVGLLPKSLRYTPSNGRSCTPEINVHHSTVNNDSSAFLQDQKASYDFNDMDADPKPRDQDPDNW